MHARLDRGRGQLLTRKGLDWTHKYPAIADALKSLPSQAYLDGDLCGVRPDGTTSFDIIQNASEPGNQAALVFFHQEGRGPAFHKLACQNRLEGIVSKPADAPYRPGERRTWQKTKCLGQDEFIVVGWSDPEGSRPYLGSLLLGYYDDAGRLHYAGRAGSEISDAELERLWRWLQPLAISECRLPSRRRRPAISARRFAGALGTAGACGCGQIPDVDRPRLAAAGRLSGRPGGQAGERGSAPVESLFLTLPGGGRFLILRRAGNLVRIRPTHVGTLFGAAVVARAGKVIDA